MKRIIILTAIAALFFSTESYAQEEEDGYSLAAVKLDWTLIEDLAGTVKGYPVSNMKDGNKATAWAGDLSVTIDGTKEFDDSAVYGDGFYGFKLSVKASSLEYLIITPGYAKSAETFRNNIRPSVITIYDGTAWKNDGGEFIDGEDYAEPLAIALLQDSPEPQIIPIKPRSGNTDVIWFCISDVVPGAKYFDNCISELEFYGQK